MNTSAKYRLYQAIKSYVGNTKMTDIENELLSVMESFLDNELIKKNIEKNRLAYLMNTYINPLDMMKKYRLTKVLALGEDNYQFVFADEEDTLYAIYQIIVSHQFQMQKNNIPPEPKKVEKPRVFFQRSNIGANDVLSIHPDLTDMMEDLIIQLVSCLAEKAQLREIEIEKTLDKRFSW